MTETLLIWVLGSAALGAPASVEAKVASYDITVGERFTTVEGLQFELSSKIHGGGYTKFELEVISGDQTEVVSFSWGAPMVVQWHIEGYAGGYIYTVGQHPDMLNGTKLSADERSRKNRLRRLTLTPVAKPPADVETLKKAAQTIAGAKIREMGCTGLGIGSNMGAGTLRAYNASTPKTEHICHVQVGLYTGVVFTNKEPLSR